MFFFFNVRNTVFFIIRYSCFLNLNTGSVGDKYLKAMFGFPTDQQADRVLPAAGPQREAG